MGCYDEIRSDFKLPIADVQNEVFQTKDLDCGMRQYTIDKFGYLVGENTDTHREVYFYTIPTQGKYAGGTVEFKAVFEPSRIRRIEIVRARTIEEKIKDLNNHTYCNDNTDES